MPPVKTRRDPNRSAQEATAPRMPVRLVLALAASTFLSRQAVADVAAQRARSLRNELTRCASCDVGQIERSRTLLPRELSVDAQD